MNTGARIVTRTGLHFSLVPWVRKSSCITHAQNEVSWIFHVLMSAWQKSRTAILARLREGHVPFRAVVYHVTKEWVLSRQPWLVGNSKGASRHPSHEGVRERIGLRVAGWSFPVSLYYAMEGVGLWLASVLLVLSGARGLRIIRDFRSSSAPSSLWFSSRFSFPWCLSSERGSSLSLSPPPRLVSWKQGL